LKNKFGVPCSKIKDKIEDVDVHCSSEEQAMALACGSYLITGKRASVYMQNSGFARCIDIITSLYRPYGIPYPETLISIRHKPYHHSFIGTITKHLLRILDYSYDAKIVEQEK